MHKIEKQIYIFDETFNFKNKIKLNFSNLYNTIIDISYCKKTRSLLIATIKQIYQFSLDGSLIKIIYEIKEKIIGEFNCTSKLTLNKSQKLIGIICCQDEILVAYTKNNIYYIGLVKNRQIEKILYKTKYKIENIFSKDNFIWITVAKNFKKEILSTNIECTCKDEKANIIDSIADIEKCLAKILCAEADKIKATIKNTNNNKELICINDSVNNLIYKITVLEFILTEKLKTVVENDKRDK